jgi:hypothetical protein
MLRGAQRTPHVILEIEFYNLTRRCFDMMALSVFPQVIIREAFKNRLLYSRQK